MKQRTINVRVWDAIERCFITGGWLQEEYWEPLSKRYTLQQDTELKDRKESKIYEGDIIQTYRDNEKSDVFPVVFKDCVFGRITDDSIVSLQIVRDWEREELEIIGNIFENPNIKL